MIPTAYEYPLNMASVVSTMEEDARRELDKLAGKLGIGDLDIKTESSTGDIYSNLKKAIEQYKPDLIAMGTHGRRVFERWILGSTAERVLRHSPAPVLTISAAKASRVPGKPLRRILVTTDLSNGTADAMQFAVTLARENKARLTVLHVLEETRAITSKKYRNEIAARVKRECEKLVPLDAKGECDVDIRIEAGTPYHVILSVLEKNKIDLAVMNTHGKGMLDRALLGSTTERVVRGAMCPVIVIPPATAKKQRPKKSAAA
jgi:nucleotide-binding universal stress UspA family protein